MRRRRGAGCPSVGRAARAGSTPRSSMRARWEPERVSPAGRTARRAGRPPSSPVPGDGATLADKRVEEIWRGRGSSGARTYVDALGHPETNLRLAHRVLLVLALTDPPDPPMSPCPRPARSTSEKIAGKRFRVARVRGSVIHDPATRSERAGVSRDGRHVGRAIASRSTLRARRRVSAGPSVEPGVGRASRGRAPKDDVVRPDLSGRLQKSSSNTGHGHHRSGGTVGGAIGATGAFRTERPWRDLSCGCPTGR